MRLKTKWGNSSGKTIKQMSSALAFSAFRLTRNQLEDLINEKFQVTTTELFEFIGAYLVFIVNIIERLSYNKLSSNQRVELITAVVKQLANYYAENKNNVLKTDKYTMNDFVAIYNKDSKYYAKCLQVDYSFYKVFSSLISENAKEEDKYWINQQINEIQAPKTYEEILKAFNNIVKVEQITKTINITAKENKIPRAKRQKTFKQRQEENK